MSSYSGDLQELPLKTLRSISNRLGVVAVLYTSKENKLARTQTGSMRTKIIDKLTELQEKHGTFLTDKHNIPEDHPARAEFIAWYLNERKADIGVKHPKEHYEKWAIIHLQDSLKHRKEASKELVTA